MKHIEKRANIKEEVVLSQKLGFRMSEPKYGFESVAGNYRLKAYLKKLLYLRDSGLNSTLSALMFFGTAGSGKTHVAQAIAKEFGYKFGLLDLPHFMTLPSPTQAIDELFDFLQDQDKRCVLLIDEIEKMFDFTGNDLKSKNVFGKLLTRLNDIYNDPKNNIVFIATANNIAQIVENAPEFMRKGRFDDVFFLSYPDERSAMAVIELFINKVREEVTETFKMLLSSDYIPANIKNLYTLIINEEDIEKIALKMSISISAEDIYSAVEDVYSDRLKISDDEEFIYSPPEINTVVKELQNTALYEVLKRVNKSAPNTLDDIPDIDNILLENNAALMETVISKINPLQISAAMGIQKQIAQAENYNNQGNSTHEHYKKA
jgi:SpoVK/Ycf46/Vps4 family AAA+-type ATPase